MSASQYDNEEPYSPPWWMACFVLLMLVGGVFCGLFFMILVSSSLGF